MPIVYVHGVANRLDNDGLLPGWDEISAYLRRYIVPEISKKPEQVSIRKAYWGGDGVAFSWQGAARPRSKMLGQGAGSGTPATEQVAELGGLGQLPSNPQTGAPTSALTSGRNLPSQTTSTYRLRDLSPDELSNFFSAAVEKVENPAKAQKAKIAADEVAHDPAILKQLQDASDLEAELGILQEALSAHGTSASLAGQGAGSWWKGLVDRVREVAVRVDSAPGYAVSRLVMEARAPINDAVTTFIGDVFQYVAQKGQNAGAIRQVVLDALRAAKEETADKEEPMIVLSHSMGGQIVFDVATNFLGPELRIDLWAAAASQVGLFEEMKLLLASDPLVRGPNGRAAFPANVGWWWNVWDSNDVLSFTTKNIFDLQVDDEEWDSGASLAAAHGAYLRRPSFYRKLAEKIQSAREINFNRP